MAFAGHCGLDIALPAARGARARAAVRRGAGCGAADPGRRRAARSPKSWRAMDSARPRSYLGAPVSELRVQIRVGAALLDEPWAELRRAWSETSWRMRRLRDDPQCADEEFAAQTAEHDPGLTRGTELRSAGGHRRALHRARRAAGGRDPARAGRQQPGGNRRGLRARRLRAARRAHDRSAGGPPLARASSRDSSPAAASPTATCSVPARAGPSRFCSTTRCARSSSASSRAPTPSRSASATAARCSRR